MYIYLYICIHIPSISTKTPCFDMSQPAGFFLNDVICGVRSKPEPIGARASHGTLGAPGDGPQLRGASGKTMGKPWENQGKTMGKPWENHGKMVIYMEHMVHL